MTDEQMAALMPVISAGRRQNSQTILIGTPPSPTCPASVFKATRDRALSNSPGRICWHEWSVESIGNIRDWSRVSATNPALDVRLMRSSVEAEMAAMSPDYFARERLGWWSRQTVQAVISTEEWKECATDERPQDGLFSYAVKFSPDGAVATVSACLRPSDGVPHIGVAKCFEMRDGLTQIADYMVQRKDRAAQFVVDGVSNAQPLIDELIRRGVNKRQIVKPRSNEVASACSSLLNAIRERGVTHFDQDALNESATKSKKRPIGSGGGWGFGDNDCDSTLIESCALAYWGALNTKRDPTRKQRMAF